MDITFGLVVAVSTTEPSFHHKISGSGSPSAWHLRVAGSFLATYVSSGCSVIRGMVPSQ